MADVYALCDNNCKYLTYTREQFLAVLQEAIANGSLDVVDPEAGFINKITEQNSGEAIKIWLGTNAEYNALATKEENTIYLISDDSSLDDVLAKIDELVATTNANTISINSNLEEINKIKDGTTIVPKAIESDNSTNALRLKKTTIFTSLNASRGRNYIDITGNEFKDGKRYEFIGNLGFEEGSYNLKWILTYHNGSFYGNPMSREGEAIYINSFERGSDSGGNYLLLKVASVTFVETNLNIGINETSDVTIQKKYMYFYFDKVNELED